MEWIAAISTTSLLIFAGWLLRNVIAARLTHTVRHEFDLKLDAARVEQRKTEDSFRAELREKEKQIDALRAGALSALASRQIALHKRRLEAIDQLWSGVTALGPMRGACQIMARMDFDEAIKASSTDRRAQQGFEIIAKNFDVTGLTIGEAAKARPFVSPMAWALFSAFHSIIGLAVLQLQMLKLGIESANMIKTGAVGDLIKVALPEYTNYVDTVGYMGFHLLVDELERRLVDELGKMADGKDADQSSIAQAALILEAASRVASSVPVQTEPAGERDATQVD